MRDIQTISGRVKQVHIKTEVGVAAGAGCLPPAINFCCYPVVMPGPLYDCEKIPKHLGRTKRTEVCGFRIPSKRRKKK